jgi:hypothetical protein
LGWFPNDAQAETLLAYLASQSGIHPLAALPEGVCAFQRGPHLIFLNFKDTPLVATVHGRPIRVGARDVEVVNLSGL